MVRILTFPCTPGPIMMVLLRLAPTVSMNDFRSVSLKLAVKVASSAQTGELHNAAASTSGSKRFFVLRPVVFLRQTDNVISRQNTMNDSPGLNAVSAARWKCRGAHP